MVELAKEVYLFIFVALICQKLFFHSGASGHFGYTPLEKNAGIFARDTGAKYFLKGSRKSNQSSKHLSQKMVMKVRFSPYYYIIFFVRPLHSTLLAQTRPPGTATDNFFG